MSRGESMLLVTGITGHSGKHFLKEMIENNYSSKVRFIVRQTSDISLFENIPLDIEVVQGELNDEAFLNNAMLGIDEIIHIASIFYSENIIKVAVNHNIDRAILVHTTGIYSMYKSASQEYKKIESNINEIITKSKSNINLIYLRPTMIYGNVNDRNMIIFIKMVDRLRIFPVIDRGQNLLQPVRGKDLGKAYYQILTQKDILKGDYILSGEKPISMIDMFKLISELLGKKTIFINVPLGIGIFLAKLLFYFTLGKIDYIEKVKRMGENRSYSHSDANADFNYTPTPFIEGLKLEINDYLKSKKI
ncbi:SDR family oxidoreductase [Acetoanaerobium noterae]|uniref:SDR family oxidoreductase n=1 Tax=Acetoanaerobium noterae TaxID=745369 RepID=UPI00333E38DE